MKYLVLICFLLNVQLCSASNTPSQSGTSQHPDAPAISSNAKVDAPVIVIDPGHPSETSKGTQAADGLSEIHVAWVVALKLKSHLEARGFRVVLTKTAETQLVTNKERALTGNRAKAALTVRLHCDAGQDSGFAIYYPDRQGTTKDGVAGPSEDVISKSKTAADALHDGMVSVLRGTLKDGGVRGDSKTFIGSKQGALTGSIFSEVPIVTVEMVVLGNKGDVAFIEAEKNQDLMARAIAEGIAKAVTTDK